MNAQEYLQQLKKQGFKLTDQRRSIVEILLEEDRYITAKELMDRMHTQYPRISYDTIYRNLHVLRDENILEESTFHDGSNRYRICCKVPHHHHFICTHCGTTIPIESCPMDLTVPVPDGFYVQSHRFEVFGECARCQSK